MSMPAVLTRLIITVRNQSGWNRFAAELVWCAKRVHALVSGARAVVACGDSGDRDVHS